MVIGIVFLMIVTKIVFKNVVGNTVNAGPERGDIRLSSAVLPEDIGEWKISNFKSPDGEGGVAGIIGWTHSWTALKEGLVGLICFDQVGFMGWHELTLCYEATGWTVTDRTLKISTSPETGDWHSVSVKLSNVQNQQALLIYSIFDGTGIPKLPPELAGYTPGSSLSNEQIRCLQCQVMFPFKGSLSLEQQESIYQLQVATRELFREEWVRQQSVSLNPVSSVSMFE